MKAMKFWIGDNPELSKKVQEILFGLGYEWNGGGNALKLMGAKGLYVSSCGRITITTKPREIYFDSEGSKEIDISWMAPERETITIGDKEYYKDELETALKNINPI